MAKDAQVMTSRWLLLAAVCLAVVAAIAVNLYIGAVTSKYEADTFLVVQITKDIPQGGKVNHDDLKAVPVPRVFESAFKQAFTAGDINWFIGGRPARNKLNAGDILRKGDFADVVQEAQPIKPPPGSEYVSLPIARESTVGSQLQPGGYISVRGRFVMNPAEKEKQWATQTVFECIQAKTLDDSTAPLPINASTYSRVGVFVKREQAKQLSDIISKAEGRRFAIGITVPTSSKQASEPEIDPILLKLIGGNKGAAEPDLVLPE